MYEVGGRYTDGPFFIGWLMEVREPKQLKVYSKIVGLVSTKVLLTQYC